jgi:hypothetical protein
MKPPPGGTPPERERPRFCIPSPVCEVNGVFGLWGWCLEFFAEHFLKFGFGRGAYVPLSGRQRPSERVSRPPWVNVSSRVLRGLVAVFRTGVRVAVPVLGASWGVTPDV